jgi:cellulose biosynthesis protein BcsQ
MTSIVFIGGGKGGTGKTTTAHLACLGAILRNHPAAYVLTDPTRKVRGEGRPYGVLDGREPENLAKIIGASHSSLNGWLFIDGGGNRLAFDQEIAAVADLTILPFKASEEDLDTVADDMQRLPQAVAWPTAWPTNAHAERAAQFMIDGLRQAFPDRVVTPAIPFVNSVSDLLASELISPSTATRQLGRKVFGTIEDWFIDHVDEARGGNNGPKAVVA